MTKNNHPEVAPCPRTACKETAKLITEGVALEKFRKVPEQAPQTMNALKIEIVMPTSGQNEARAGSIGGVPMSFVEGEKV